MSVHHSLRVRVAAGTAALLSALGLVAAHAGAVQQTDAAWTDTEVAQAQVTAKWPLSSYARTAQWSGVSNSYPSVGDYNNGHSPYDVESSQNVNESVTVISAPESGTYNSAKYTIERAVPPPGEIQNPYSRTAQDSSLDLHTANGVYGGSDGTSAGGKASGKWLAPSTVRCVTGGTTVAPAGTVPTTNNCLSVPGTVSAATSKVQQYGFSADFSRSTTLFNFWDVSTAVRCDLDNGVATAPTGNIELGGELYNADTHNYFDYSHKATSDSDAGWRQLANGTITTTSFSPYQLVQIGMSSYHLWVRWKLLVTQKTAAATGTSNSYARSEAGVYAEWFESSSTAPPTSATTPNLKMYLIISRSECGVQPPTSSTTARPASTFFPTISSLSGAGQASESDFSAFSPAPTTLMAMRAQAATTSTTAATTTSTQASTSPLATTTAAQTTTSAPPSTVTTAPSVTESGTTAAAATDTTVPVTTETVTSNVPTTDTAVPPTTTEASTVVVPADPGTLSPTEPTSICGNVQSVGTFTDVVAKDSGCPADATESVVALDRWITDGVQSDPQRVAHTSQDPATDGWRWAVVSQVTGAVLYVR